MGGPAGRVIPRRSADIGYWLADGNAGSQDIEVRLAAQVSRLPMTFDDAWRGSATLSSLGLGLRTRARRPVRIAAEDEDDDIGFLALHGVHGADPLLPIRSAYLGARNHRLRGLADDHAERADHPICAAFTPASPSLEGTARRRRPRQESSARSRFTDLISHHTARPRNAGRSGVRRPSAVIGDLVLMPNVGRSHRRCTRSGLPTHTGSSLAGPGSAVPCSASRSATCCTDVRLGARCSPPELARQRRWPPQGNVTAGFSGAAPTITARLAHHRAPTAYCGGACPASSTNSRPTAHSQGRRTACRRRRTWWRPPAHKEEGLPGGRPRRVLGAPLPAKDLHRRAEVPAECGRLGQDQRPVKARQRGQDRRPVQGERREEQLGPRRGELRVSPRSDFSRRWIRSGSTVSAYSGPSGTS